MSIKEIVNNILIRWYYVKKNEIEILEKVAERQRETDKSRDNSYLLRVWLIESTLGYKDKPDEFKRLYTSLIKRGLLKLIEQHKATYFRETEGGKKCLAEYESFIRSSWLYKISKILEHQFSPILVSLLALTLSIISIYLTVHKG